MRSKRLRTTEEPVALDGSSVLGSTKKGLGGSSGPKARKSAVRSTCREEEKEKEANSKHSQFSGKNFEIIGFFFDLKGAFIWPGENV